ncbi:Succinate dehydrogenase assembly factor 2 mitochondrial [Sorochytrium milnesiophthora]
MISVLRSASMRTAGARRLWRSSSLAVARGSFATVQIQYSTPKTSWTPSDPWDVLPQPDPNDTYSPPVFRPPPRLEPDGSPESRARKIRRLVYQSRKRGILETDLLCSLFADRHLDALSDAELAAYDALLDENDWDIYYWATGAKPVPERINAAVMDRLREVAKNEARAILKMPDLKASR